MLDERIWKINLCVFTFYNRVWHLGSVKSPAELGKQALHNSVFDNCFLSYGITSNTNQHITHEFATNHLVSLYNIKGETNYYFFSNKGQQISDVLWKSLVKLQLTQGMSNGFICHNQINEENKWKTLLGSKLLLLTTKYW